MLICRQLLTVGSLSPETSLSWLPGQHMVTRDRPAGRPELSPDTLKPGATNPYPMPRRKLHKAITERVLGVPGTDVHKLLDSTAHAHGPRHRLDREHSIAGVAVELARRGQLTSQNLQVAQLHILTDQVMSAVYRRVLPKGALRQPAQEIVEDLLVKAIRPKKRRRGRRPR